MPWSNITLGAVLGPVAAAVGSITKELNKQLAKLMALKALLSAALASFIQRMQQMQNMLDALQKAGFYCIRLAPGQGSWNTRLRYAPGAPPDDSNGYSCGICVIVLDPNIKKLIKAYEDYMKSLYGFKNINLNPERVQNKTKAPVPKPKVDVLATNIWMSATLKDLMPGLFATTADALTGLSGVGSDIQYALAQAELALQSTMGSLNEINDFMSDLLGAGAYVIMLPPKKGGFFSRIESEVGHPPFSSAYSSCGFSAVSYAPSLWELNEKYAAIQSVFENKLEDGINIFQMNPDTGEIDWSKPQTNTPIEVGVSNPDVGIGIFPTGVQILPGSQVQFKAIVSLPPIVNPEDPTQMITQTIDQTVFWGVEGLGQGEIDGQGLYTAPSVENFIPNQPPVIIRCWPLADLYKSAQAEIELVEPEYPEISVIIIPDFAQVTVGTNFLFSAIVYGTGNQNVTWSVDPPHLANGRLTGVINKDGLYTAPSYPVITKVHVASVEDPTKTDSCTVTIVAPLDDLDAPLPGDPDVPIPDNGSNADIKPYVPPPPPPPPVTHLTVAVGITPTYGSVLVGSTLQFTANLVNETQVTWSCQGVGTIDQNGLYAAPTNPIQPVIMDGGAQNHVVPDIVIATSVNDPTKFASALVYVIQNLTGAASDVPIPGDTDVPIKDNNPATDPLDTYD